jgi:hypothetical protein
MSVFRIWNRVPPSIEWPLSGKCRAMQELVTWEFAAQQARYSDSRLRNRSWITLDEKHEPCPCPGSTESDELHRFCAAHINKSLNTQGEPTPSRLMRGQLARKALPLGGQDLDDLRGRRMSVSSNPHSAACQRSRQAHAGVGANVPTAANANGGLANLRYVEGMQWAQARPPAGSI